VAGSPPLLQAARRVVGVAIRAHSLSAELAAMKRHMQMQDTQPHNLLVTGSPETTEIATSHALLPNGDEVDARMEKIQTILGYAAMPLLDKYALVHEWVRHAELKAPVSDQSVAKPRGGRPEGGITRAANGELPIPGKTFLGRRKYIVRAISIDAIWDEAKSATRAARLDNMQWALLAIAHEHSLEAQLAKVREITARRSAARRKPRKSTQPEQGGGSNLQIQNAVPEPAARREQTMTVEQETQLATLRTSWRIHKVLRREEFENTSAEAQGYFIRDELLGITTLRKTEDAGSTATVAPANVRPQDRA
jgi:hypothetical protein